MPEVGIGTNNIDSRKIYPTAAQGRPRPINFPVIYCAGATTSAFPGRNLKNPFWPVAKRYADGEA